MNERIRFELTIHVQRQGYSIVDQAGKFYCEPIPVGAGFYDMQGKILTLTAFQTKYFPSLEAAKNKALELMSEMGVKNLEEGGLVNV